MLLMPPATLLACLVACGLSDLPLLVLKLSGKLVSYCAHLLGFIALLGSSLAVAVWPLFTCVWTRQGAGILSPLLLPFCSVLLPVAVLNLFSCLLLQRH